MIPEPGLQKPIPYWRAFSTRFPGKSARAYLCRGSRQEIVDLLVDSLCAFQILDTANLSLDKMVAVDRGGNGGGVHARRHELEESHLRGCVLARYTL